MTDIFFSYSSVDRERVSPIRDAFVARGFDVFWDQEVPAGVDWDSWIRQHLSKSKCAVVFWSSASVASKNVRHEATVADRQSKLIPVLLEPLTAEQFPMGHYAQEAANLVGWSNDFDHVEWLALAREIERKLTPQWLQRRMEDLEAELAAERTRRVAAERRDRTTQNRIVQDSQALQNLMQERDDATETAGTLSARVEGANRARSEMEAQVAELSRRLSVEEVESQTLQIERNEYAADVARFKETIDKLLVADSEMSAEVARLRREAEEWKSWKENRDATLREAAALEAHFSERARSRLDYEAREAEMVRDWEIVTTGDRQLIAEGDRPPPAHSVSDRSSSDGPSVALIWVGVLIVSFFIYQYAQSNPPRSAPTIQTGTRR